MISKLQANDDPVISREEAIAILNTPDEQLELFSGLCLLCPPLPFHRIFNGKAGTHAEGRRA